MLCFVVVLAYCNLINILSYARDFNARPVIGSYSLNSPFIIQLCLPDVAVSSNQLLETSTVPYDPVSPNAAAAVWSLNTSVDDCHNRLNLYETWAFPIRF